MFNNEIKFIIDYSTNKVKSLESKATLAELIKSGLHPAIIKYISAQISLMIENDRQKLLKESSFDYNTKSINNYFSLITKEIKKNYKIDLNTVNKAINIAVNLHFNHLLRPKFTITKLLFNKDNVKNTNEIKLLLSHFYYYDYFINLIIKYLDKKHPDYLTTQEFTELYDKIDRLLLETYPSYVLESNINGTCDFFNIGDVNKNKMHLSAFELFLGEKNLTEYIIFLKENFGDDLKLKIDKNELLNFIKENPIDFVKEKIKQKLESKEIEEIIPDNLQIKKDEVKKDEEIKEETKEELTDREENVVAKNEEEIKEEVKVEEEPTTEVQDNSSEELINSKEEDNKINVEEELIEDNKQQDEIVEDEEEDIIENEEENKADDVNLINEDELDKDEILEMLNDELHNDTIGNVEEEIILEKKEEVIFEESEENDANLEDVKLETSETEQKELDESIKFEEIKIEFNDADIKDEKIDEEEVNDDTEEEIIESAIDFENLMNEKDITKIIKNIFNDDYEEFADHIEKMGQLKNIDEVIIYINTYCNNIGISENKKEIVLLKKLITHHYKR